MTLTLMLLASFWTSFWVGADPKAPVGLRALEILHVGGETQVLLGIEGEVEPRAARRSNPDRIVLELPGVQWELVGEAFRGINRGGVLGIQGVQTEEGLLEVIVELSAPLEFELLSGTGYVRIALAHPGAPFDPWRVGTEGGPSPASAVLDAPEPPVLLPRAPAAEPPRRISVSFAQTPLTEVIFTFSEFSGRSIVPGAGVGGTVSADIRDQPWDIAFQAILESQGLVAEEAASGIIRVDRLDELARRADVEPLVTRPFRIHFAQAPDLQASVQTLLTSRGRMSVSRSTNSIVVTDIARVLDQIEALIAGLDIRTPEITISAKIIFVERTELEDMGVVYDLKDSRGNQLGAVTPAARPTTSGGLEFLSPGLNTVSLGGNSIAALGNANERVTGHTLQLLTSLVLGRYTLLNFVEALSSVNLSDVQASPQIRVLENTEARIHVGERTPILQQREQTGDVFYQPPTIQFQETGIKLDVTPQVATGDLIFLRLRAERSGVVFTPDVAVGLIFNTQEATTSVLVESGETVVIGGLTVTESLEIRTGIPILMKMPVLGRFFRRTQERRNQRDLIILVTPEINRY